MVQQLEQQYDAFMERYREEHPQAIMPGEEAVPSAEEISEEFEAFLASLDESDSEEIIHTDIDDREDSADDDDRDLGDDI